MARLTRLALIAGCVAVAAGTVMLLTVSEGPASRDSLPRPAVAAGAAVPPHASPESGARHGAADERVPPPAWEPHEVLVANAPETFRTLAGGMGFRVVEALTLHHLGLRVYRVRLPAGTDVPAGIARLRARFPQILVDADHRYDTSVGRDMPASFARAAIGWSDLPADCGGNVRLGMIDSGVDTGHPALAGADVLYRTFNRSGRAPGPAEHGTAVAALMVGRPAAGTGWGGLLPGASLHAANIFEITPAGTSVATARGLISAVDWLVGQRVHALNLSIAGPDNEVVKRAIGRAAAGGLIGVAAAGNWGSATRPAYPAAYPEVIAVTAVAADRRVYSHANRGRWIDFAAPGVRLWTAVPDGGRYQSGTSFASPYVAVQVGTVVAAGIGTDAEGLRRQLRSGAVDLGKPGRDEVFGWGLVAVPPRCAATSAPEPEPSLGRAVLR